MDSDREWCVEEEEEGSEVVVGLRIATVVIGCGIGGEEVGGCFASTEEVCGGPGRCPRSPVGSASLLSRT